jgi:hypothetical protein
MSKMQDTKTLSGTGGESFELTCIKLEPVAAYMLVAKLGKVLLPVLVAMRTRKPTDDMSPVVDQIFSGLTPELAQQVMLELLSTVTVVRTGASGQPQKFDLCNGQVAINNAFRGNVMTMFKVMGFALEVNFSDFFDVSGLVSRMAPTPSA